MHPLAETTDKEPPLYPATYHRRLEASKWLTSPGKSRTRRAAPGLVLCVYAVLLAFAMASMGCVAQRQVTKAAATPAPRPQPQPKPLAPTKVAKVAKAAPKAADAAKKGNFGHHAQALEVPTHQMSHGHHPHPIGSAFKRPALPPSQKTAAAPQPKVAPVADSGTGEPSKNAASPQPKPSTTKQKHAKKSRRKRHTRRRRRRARRRARRRRRRAKRRLARRRARRRRSRRRWQKRFTARRIIKWHNLLRSLQGAKSYFTRKDAKRVYRSVRWKFRRALRKYHSIPKALKRDIRAFLASLRLIRDGKQIKSHQALLFKRGKGPVAKTKSTCAAQKTATKECPEPKAARKRTYARRFGRFYWPTTSRYIASGFGWRKGPFTGRRGFHSGLDIAAKYRAPVFAAASGRVVKVGWYGGCGLAIFLWHRGGLKTGYCHLAEIHVKKGQWIKGGHPIGAAGSTGSATSTHLHFTVQRRRRYLNPMPYLRRRYRRRRRRYRRKRRRRRKRKRRHKRRKPGARKLAS